MPVFKMLMILTMSYLSSPRLRTPERVSRKSALQECQWKKLWSGKARKVELTGMWIQLCSEIGLFLPKIKLGGRLGSGLEAFKMIRRERVLRMPSSCWNSQTMMISNLPQRQRQHQHLNLNLPQHQHQHHSQTIKMIQSCLQQDTSFLIQFMWLMLTA